MSREVEVKNIKMTATVPEDIQISLGHLVNFSATATGDALVSNASTFTGLSGNQGILKSADTNAADNGNVMAPYNNGNDAVTALDWASSADISEYYRLGKIIPASSTTGADIYFTPDAAGVGKTLKAGAAYYQAADIDGAKAEVASTGRTADTDNPDGSLKTTLHAINDQDESADTWNTGATGDAYKTATEWNITNDDGYFVDIPVWFRSSAQTELTLSVDAYVTTTQAKDDDDLYCAARAVILYNATAETGDGANKGGYASAANATSNLIRIKQDGLTKDGTTTKGDSIVDYMYTTNSTGDAVSSTAGAYGNAIEYQGLQFIPVAAGANNTYGPMTKAVIRVWLEGEDPNCWNSNAGQDFNISLVFSKDNISAVEAKTDNNTVAITDSNKGTGTYAATKISHDGTGFGANSTTDSLKAGARVWVTSKTTVDGTDMTDLLQFEYNGTKWSLVSDGSFHKYEGFTYTYNSATITTSDDIATQLKSTVKTLADVQAADTTGEAIAITVAASGS